MGHNLLSCKLKEFIDSGEVIGIANPMTKLFVHFDNEAINEGFTKGEEFAESFYNTYIKKEDKDDDNDDTNVDISNDSDNKISTSQNQTLD